MIFNARTKHATHILEKLHQHLSAWNARTLPNSEVQKAIQYAPSQWEALTLFLTNPGILLDNNLIENQMPLHPCARGEQLIVLTVMYCLVGSSPRTRGTVGAALVLGSGTRFIPAHAGNSLLTGVWAQLGSVHPRARGEQENNTPFCSSTCGSSPRTRGTGTYAKAVARAERFIPAHAGNSIPLYYLYYLNSVHPRARGEQRLCCISRVYASGSSPRTRGTGTHLGDWPLVLRFIPAHAGNRR